MNAYVGAADKIIRIIIGIGMLAYAWLGQGQYRWIGWFGVVPIATVLGIKTTGSSAPR